MMRSCKESFNNLYNYLNSDVKHLDPKRIEKHLALCRNVCDVCKFNKEVLKAIQTQCFDKKASSKLKNKILKELRQPQ